MFRERKRIGWGEIGQCIMRMEWNKYESDGMHEGDQGWRWEGVNVEHHVDSNEQGNWNTRYHRWARMNVGCRQFISW